MAFLRRRLGTGPTIPSPAPAGAEHPGRPAAERIGPSALLVTRDGEQLPAQKGRRNLETGGSSPAVDDAYVTEMTRGSGLSCFKTNGDSM
ncbi:hypothetical protein [Streptomyces sp. NPDC005989]|uniref:hypothetical protein n=1 Tax=Streptomyces sp. NPDC005989 TaxID=3156727 RepID=UPI0033C89632